MDRLEFLQTEIQAYYKDRDEAKLRLAIIQGTLYRLEDELAELMRGNK